jgi:cytochrome c556
MKHAIILSLLMLAAVPACAAEDQPAAGEKMEQHGVASERLRTIMERINLSVHDNNNVDAIGEPIGRQDMADMVEAVEELLYHAELMSTGLSRPDFTAKQIVTFRALAAQLYTEALNVRDTAEASRLETYDFNLLNSAYERLYQTCTACHDLFRDR